MKMALGSSLLSVVILAAVAVAAGVEVGGREAMEIGWEGRQDMNQSHGRIAQRRKLSGE